MKLIPLIVCIFFTMLWNPLCANSTYRESTEIPVLAPNSEGEHLIAIFTGEDYDATKPDHPPRKRPMLEKMDHAAALTPSVLNEFDPHFPQLRAALFDYRDFASRDAFLEIVQGVALHATLIVFDGHGGPDSMDIRYTGGRWHLTVEDIRKMRFPSGVNVAFVGCNTGSKEYDGKKYGPDERLLEAALEAGASTAIGISELLLGIRSNLGEVQKNEALNAFNIDEELLTIYWEGILAKGTYRAKEGKPYKPYLSLRNPYLESCTEELTLPSPFRVLRRK